MATFDDALDGSLGCIFLVGFFSLMLYGCTCGQVMHYLTHYFSSETGDHTYIKTTVILIWILDTGKTIVDTICGWDLLIFDHGDALALAERLPGIVPAEFVVSVWDYVLLATIAPSNLFTQCTTIFIVQCCYLHTIWRFLQRSQRNKHWPLFMFLPLLLALGSLAAGLIGAVQIRAANSIDDAYSKAEIAGALRPGLAAIVDIYITVWLCYHLQDAKTGHTESDSKIAKLINYSITRGICTSVAQVMAFALFLVDEKNKTLWSMIFYIPASTLYVNSLLAMWNGRRTAASPNSTLVPTSSESQGTYSTDIPLESRSFVSRTSMKPPPSTRHVFVCCTLEFLRADHLLSQRQNT
ncbi:hypothetical protein FOMPIDRAFT_1055498 [Fomitopsis schrenkii]|uniref:DUF6534 domain-containing protein n=1 Tax=Fomitopsis schrenkii TaxID=2126942 RepID=S8F4U3_FOMSC|nr:hypothetical protein FOMPIDRAFT_1055498 [Fomitopsis schrenkii]